MGDVGGQLQVRRRAGALCAGPALPDDRLGVQVYLQWWLDVGGQLQVRRGVSVISLGQASVVFPFARGFVRLCARPHPYSLVSARGLCKARARGVCIATVLAVLSLA